MSSKPSAEFERRRAQLRGSTGATRAEQRRTAALQRQKRLAADRFAVLRQLVEAEAGPEETDASPATAEPAAASTTAAEHHPTSPQPKKSLTSRLASQLQVPEVRVKLPGRG